MLRYVLLGALSYLPLTGYQIKQFIDQSARHFWHAQTSQIYRTLDALEKEGMVESERQPQNDRPDRRVYSLTDAGRADLLAWLHQPMTEIEPTKDTLLVRLFFAALVDKETTLTQLRLQRALHVQQLELFRARIPEQIRRGLAGQPGYEREAILWDQARRLGELGTETMIRWLDETIRRIEESP